VLLSDKDQRHPRLSELPDFFVYEAPGNLTHHYPCEGAKKGGLKSSTL
jgi:hypothetical protein